MTAPKIALRMMVYVLVDGKSLTPDAKEVTFEPHPFEPSMAASEMQRIAREFIDEQIARLEKLYV